MKIMHVCETVTGGIATYLNNVVAEQARRPEVEAVSVLLPRTQLEEINLDDIDELEGKIHIVGFEGDGRVQRLKHLAMRLRGAVSKARPDVVHVHSTFAGFLCRALPISFHGAKLIYQPHGVAFDPHRTSGLKRHGIQWVEKALYQRTDGVVAISEYERTLLEEAGMGDKTLLIKNCVRDTREAIGEGRKEDFYLFIGRFDRQKGFDKLHAFWGEDRPLLKIVGGNVVDSDATFTARDNMEFLGWQDNTALDGLIARAKALIVPSRWEGFGLVVLEAYRNATPVICSNRGALPELVSHGDTGFVFDFDDFPASLSTAMAAFDRCDRQAMGRRCRERYERDFSPVSMNTELLKLYQHNGQCYV
ncbi:glycosyltransferase family 4 protein [Salinicola corii]|uniref:Glycosyltransferase family 4 protein n=1 Tax=Salinicola corii TaxID=2606937 RepID=A0A640WGN5_9GAMM|nr:glycosyltransferase family 4 protein [Salinicola corii]KAA0019346.1 glycosyltransferase family 4 protein [Salinicola corii]